MANETVQAIQPPWYRLPAATAVLPKAPPEKLNQHAKKKPAVIVIGAGLAGCHTAYELAQRNIPVLLLEAGEQVATGASGSDTGIVKPFVTRAPTQTNPFYQAAFEHLLHQLNRNGRLSHAAQFNQCGVLQLVEKTYPEHSSYLNCTAQHASSIAGTNVNSNAIFFERAGWLNPASLCRELTSHPLIEFRSHCEVTRIQSTTEGWCVQLQPKTKALTHEAKQPDDRYSNTAQQTGHLELQCTTLILANGHNLASFEQTNALPITPARGQTSQYSLVNSHRLKTVVSGKRYAIPLDDKLTVGASFARGNTRTELTELDHAENHSALKSLLPDLTPEQTPSQGFCAIRATTPDRLPLVGPVPDFSYYSQAYALLKNGLPESRFSAARYQQGLYVIGGFGSRGIVSAPYCAKLLVDHLCEFKPTSADNLEDLSSWSSLLHPARFTIRALRKSSS